MNSDSLRFILGLKLKQQRTQKHLSLKAVAEKTGLSISYLSEIEKGKKYPKPEKLLQLSEVLGIPFDALVSTQLSDQLDPLRAFLGSEVLQEFPFHLFGITGQDLLDVVNQEPERASALIRTLVEIAAEYDMQVEQFLYAALRSWQAMQGNHFPDLEEAARNFRSHFNWSPDADLDGDKLIRIARTHFDLHPDFSSMADQPDLVDLRSVRLEDSSPSRLLINPRLRPAQRHFILLREIGYRILGLINPPSVSGSGFSTAHSFEELMTYFKASYFAGAVLLDESELVRELRKVFDREEWDPQSLQRLKQRYGVTPELFLYRLSQLIPGSLGLKQLYYQRFHHKIGTQDFLLTKRLNVTPIFMYHGIGLNENYCRRWTPIAQLRTLAQFPPQSPLTETYSTRRLRFLSSGAEFLTFSIARRLQLKPDHLSAISIGILLDDHAKNIIRFWNDPAIPVVEVHETCERCALSELSCTDRATPNRIYQQQQKQHLQRVAFEKLLFNIKKE